ncbi:MAG: CoA-binding protein [Verrucomicrobia bacterium]|nr:CoA-binding protein [Verrucomicrobiota bacterium]
MKRIAIIGASKDRAKFGNKAVRGFARRGYEVYPVHPTEQEIEGRAVYRSIRDVPERPDLVSVYLAPDRLVKVLPEIAERGCDELWLNPGTESELVLSEARGLGLNVIQACSLVGHGISPNERELADD